MADILSKTDDVRICIPEAVTKGGVTVYVIQVRVGPVEWHVSHRFKDFAEVRSLLFKIHARIASVKLINFKGNGGALNIKLYKYFFTRRFSSTKHCWRLVSTRTACRKRKSSETRTQVL